MVLRVISSNDCGEALIISDVNASINASFFVGPNVAEVKASCTTGIGEPSPTNDGATETLGIGMLAVFTPSRLINVPASNNRAAALRGARLVRRSATLVPANVLAHPDVVVSAGMDAARVVIEGQRSRKWTSGDARFSSSDSA